MLMMMMTMRTEGQRGESLVDGNQKNAFEEIVIGAGTRTRCVARVSRRYMSVRVPAFRINR